MFRPLLVFLLLMLTLVRPLPASAGELPARPVPFRFIADQARLLSPEAVKSLDNGLRRYEARTGTQVVVVTVLTLDGRPVAEYARALRASWHLNRPGSDRGLLLLIAAREHTVSIQAGQSLRAAITPVVVRQVIEEQMLPNFSQGNYFRGLRAGLNTLLKAAESVPASSARPPRLAARRPATAAPDTLAGAGAVLRPTTLAPASAALVAAPAPAARWPAQGHRALWLLGLGTVLVGGGLWVRRRRQSARRPSA